MSTIWQVFNWLCKQIECFLLGLEQTQKSGKLSTLKNAFICSWDKNKSFTKYCKFYKYFPQQMGNVIWQEGSVTHQNLLPQEFNSLPDAGKFRPKIHQKMPGFSQHIFDQFFGPFASYVFFLSRQSLLLLVSIWWQSRYFFPRSFLSLSEAHVPKIDSFEKPHPSGQILQRFFPKKIPAFSHQIDQK